MRIGQGFDVHRLVKGRKLILGGVEIEFDMGLEGHSDADVLTHAIMDALLGAANLGDIGKHFPSSDPKFKDADSIELLVEVVQLIRDAGYINIVNIDATIIAEQPKMLPHIPAMRARLAAALDIQEGGVSVKATTSERLGYTGRGEGIAAMAVCLIK